MRRLIEGEEPDLPQEDSLLGYAEWCHPFDRTESNDLGEVSSFW